MTRRWGAPRSTNKGAVGAGRAWQKVPPTRWITALTVRLLDKAEDRHARNINTYNASQGKGNP